MQGEFTIGTLGPKGTNSEQAARHYLKQLGIEGGIELFDTFEEAMDALVRGEIDATIACVVYPQLNDLTFNARYFGRSSMQDIFLYPTDEMLLVKRMGVEKVKRVCAHPAIGQLAGPDYEIVSANPQSNAVAAKACLRGETEGAITTKTCYEASPDAFEIIESFGRIPMGWSVYKRLERDDK